MTALLRREPGAADALYARYSSRIYGLGLVHLKNTGRRRRSRPRHSPQGLAQGRFVRSAAGVPGCLDLAERSPSRDRSPAPSKLETWKLSSEQRRSEVSDEPSPEWDAEHRDLIQRARRAMGPAPAGSAPPLNSHTSSNSHRQEWPLQSIPPGTLKRRVRAWIATHRRSLAEEGLGRPTTHPCERAEAIE
jgi:hypothetical protein